MRTDNQVTAYHRVHSDLAQANRNYKSSPESPQDAERKESELMVVVEAFLDSQYDRRPPPAVFAEIMISWLTALAPYRVEKVRQACIEWTIENEKKPKGERVYRANFGHIVNFLDAKRDAEWAAKAKEMPVHPVDLAPAKEIISGDRANAIASEYGFQEIPTFKPRKAP